MSQFILFLGINSIFFSIVFYRQQIIKTVSLVALLIGILLIERYLNFTTIYLNYPFLKILLTNSWLFLGPSLFFFFSHFIDEFKNSKQPHFLVPIAVSFIVLIHGLIYSADQTLKIQFYLISIIYTTQILFYMSIILKHVYKTQYKISALKRRFLLLFIVILVNDLFMFPLSLYLPYNYPFYLNVYFILISSLTYILVYLHLDQPDLFKLTYFKNKYLKSNLSQIRVDDKLMELEQLMKMDRLFLDSELTASKLAGSLNLTKQQLSELLNKQIKLRFVDYINQYRLDFAISLLSKKNEDDSISQIAYQSGFNSIATFYRYFQQRYSCSPSQFKKSILVDQMR